MDGYFKNRFQEFSFISVLMLAFIAFYVETDIYTPSFPIMMDYFGTNEDTIQMLLSMNFLGLCLSCLFFGPASDAFGRKPILCAGLSIFTLGSLGCAVADSLDWMIAFRFFQGVGCGSITSAGVTMFFDVYVPEKSSRLVAICNGTIGGMTALAPMIGNWISLNFGWRTNFYLIAILAALSLVSIFFIIRETLPIEKRTKLHFTNVLKNYVAVITNFPFMAHTTVWCLGFSMIFVFIANLSLIFVDYLKVPKEHFGYYQTAIMGTYFLGCLASAYFNAKIGMEKIKIVGSLLYICGVIYLAGLTFSNVNSPLLLIIAMSLVSCGSALAMTIYFSYSMAHLPDHLKGSAMSFTQSFRLLLSSGLVGVAASSFDGTTKPMTQLAIASTIICLTLYLALYTRNQHQPQTALNAASM